MLGSASEMILTTSASVTLETKAPPCSRGTVMPQRPLCEKRSISACGRVRFWSRSAAPRANSPAGAAPRYLGGVLLGDGHSVGVVADDVGKARAVVGEARGGRPRARRNLGE